MKLQFILYYAIMFLTSVNAQNEELDKRNGFKSLKLGTSIEQFENLEVTNKTEFQTSTLWIPSKDSELNYMFDNKIDLFTLVFDSENKLSQIKLSLFKNAKPNDISIANQFKFIERKLSSVLGKPSSMPEELLKALKKDIYINLMWKGEKVVMFLYFEINDRYLNKENEFISLQSINLLIKNKTSKESYSSGF